MEGARVVGVTYVNAGTMFRKTREHNVKAKCPRCQKVCRPIYWMESVLIPGTGHYCCAPCFEASAGTQTSCAQKEESTPEDKRSRA